MLFRGKVGYFYLFLGYAMLLYVILARCRGIQAWLLLIAFREDEEAARMLGVPTVRVRLIALGASAALTAVGGTLYAQYYQFLDPASTFGINFSIQVALLTMVGGIGTAAGPFFRGAPDDAARAVLPGVARRRRGGLVLALYGIALILVVLFLPNGIVPEVRRRLGGRAHAEADDDAA